MMHSHLKTQSVGQPVSQTDRGVVGYPGHCYCEREIAIERETVRASAVLQISPTPPSQHHTTPHHTSTPPPLVVGSCLLASVECLSVCQSWCAVGGLVCHHSFYHTIKAFIQACRQHIHTHTHRQRQAGRQADRLGVVTRREERPIAPRSKMGRDGSIKKADRQARDHLVVVWTYSHVCHEFHHSMSSLSPPLVFSDVCGSCACHLPFIAASVTVCGQ
mmetsp:Transcript_48368/g.121082  ORF Transcript_48368/g.121082 Transcript_48368/m.121082 type:complete len:218 (-) Transcript_48368:1467-2120(-)